MNSHSILVIDDSPDSRDMYRELLSLDGYCVYAVATVDAARKVFREHRPPVVVIDDDPEGIHAVVIAAQLEQEAVALSEGMPTFIAIRGDFFAGEQAPLSRIEHVLRKPLDFMRLDRILHESVASRMQRAPSSAA